MFLAGVRKPEYPGENMPTPHRKDPAMIPTTTRFYTFSTTYLASRSMR